MSSRSKEIPDASVMSGGRVPDEEEVQGVLGHTLRVIALWR